MPTVVYTDTADMDTAVGIAQLQGAGHQVIRLETHDADEIAAAAPQAQALAVGYAPISAELLDRLPEVEVISMLATGYDNVDMAVVARRGLCLATVGGVAAPDVATHALALTLALIRDLPHYLGLAQNQGWFQFPEVVPPRTADLTIGLVGLGRIGSTLRPLLEPLFKRVVFSDPAQADGLSLDELADISDVVIVCVPLLASTRHLIDRTFLDRMRPGSYLVNVGRGGVVDSAAVRSAIDSSHLAGAAFDVLDQEPPPSDHPLLGHPKILVTPHTAYLSTRTEESYALIQAQNLIDWFEGHPVANAVTGVRQRDQAFST